MIIFDLEGTITKSAHREHLRLDKKYDEYNEKLYEDQPNLNVISRLKTLYNLNFDIVILTAKPEQYYTMVESWLSFYDVPYDALVMRQDHDDRSSPDFKQEFVFKNKDRIAKAFDDRDDVIAMYRENDIEAIKVENL